MNGRHNYPGKSALNPLIALLATLGLTLAVLKRKKLENKIFLSYFALAVLPSLLVFTKENPNMLRSFTSLASIAYFATLGIFYLYKKVKIDAFKKTAIVLILLFIAALYDGRTYFIYQAEVFNHSFEVKCPLTRVLPIRPLTLAEIPWWCRTHSPLEEKMKPLHPEE